MTFSLGVGVLISCPFQKYMFVLVVPKTHHDEISAWENRINLIKFISFLSRKGPMAFHKIKLKFVIFHVTLFLQDILPQLNLGIKDARGQCYDGAANMAGKTSGVTVQFKKLNTKMLYTHCHGHALNLAVKDVCFKVDVLKMTFEITREICKLVKESPQRNNKLEEIRKTTNYQAKNLQSFCPTRWTVRGQTLDSIINNYEQLMSLWEWSLQNLTNTEMKARIHDAISHMKKIDFFSVVD